MRVTLHGPGEERREIGLACRPRWVEVPVFAEEATISHDGAVFPYNLHRIRRYERAGDEFHYRETDQVVAVGVEDGRIATERVKVTE